MFLLGIIFEWKKPIPYMKLRDYINSYSLELSKNNIDHNYDCISSYEFSEKISYESHNFSIIVGHAYGNPQSGNPGLSPQLETFLNEVKKEKLNKIYFTGDVFNIPARRKWEKLIDKYDKKIKVAPGNHDIGYGENAKRDIFFDFFPKYPIEENYDDNVVLILNTVDSESSLSRDNLNYIINKIQDNPDKDFFILVHHILRPSPEKISNFFQNNPITISNNENLISNLNLLNSFGNKIYFISGDTGGTRARPRLNCYIDKNVSFISSGIGDHIDDVVLVKRGREIFYTRINKSNDDINL